MVYDALTEPRFRVHIELIAERFNETEQDRVKEVPKRRQCSIVCRVFDSRPSTKIHNQRRRSSLGARRRDWIASHPSSLTTNCHFYPLHPQDSWIISEQQVSRSDVRATLGRNA